MSAISSFNPVGFVDLCNTAPDQHLRNPSPVTPIPNPSISAPQAPAIQRPPIPLLHRVDIAQPVIHWRSMLINRYAYMTLGLTVTCAVLVSCQGLLVAQILVAVGNKDLVLGLTYLGVCLGIHWFSTTFNDLYAVFLSDKWTDTASQKFNHRALEINHSRPEIPTLSLIPNTTDLQADAQKNIQAITRLIKDGVFYSVSILTNIAVIASMISSLWLLPALASIAIGLILYVRVDPFKCHELTPNVQEAQKARTEAFNQEMADNRYRSKNAEGNIATSENLKNCQHNYKEMKHSMDWLKLQERFWMGLLVYLPCAGLLLRSASFGIEALKKTGLSVSSTLFLIDQLLKIAKTVSDYKLEDCKMDALVKRTPLANIAEWNDNVARAFANRKNIHIYHNEKPMVFEKINEDRAQLCTGGRWRIGGKDYADKQTVLLSIRKYFIEQQSQKTIHYWSPEISLSLPKEAGDSVETTACKQI